MNVADLLDILTDPDLPGDTPVRVHLAAAAATLDAEARSVATTGGTWELQGAHGTLAGSDRHLVLELRKVTLAGKEDGS